MLVAEPRAAAEYAELRQAAREMPTSDEQVGPAREMATDVRRSTSSR